MQPGYQPDTVVIGESTPQMGQATTSPFGATGAIMAARPMQMMGFFDAVKNILINNYAGFEGRASRSEYWWFFLFTLMIAVPLTMIDGALFGWEYEDPTWITWIFQLAVFLPTLAVGVRRLHDSGRSGWYLFVSFIPCVGIILLLVWLCEDGEAMPNAYGLVPTNQLH
tara:strand:+ start:99 stop:602 length:504 start_codon:yes stop_codon:yes gene_type:complete